MVKKSQLFLAVLVLLVVEMAVFAYGNPQQRYDRKKNVNQQHQQQQKPHSKPVQNKNKPNKQAGQKVEMTQQNKWKYVTKKIPNLGSVRGRILNSEWSGKPIIQFLDIPYAKAPVGVLRFKPPVPADPWQKVFNAAKPHPGCPSLQNMHLIETYSKKDLDIEDCLRLTVNTKSLTGNAPVMIYIHGDFLYDGSSAEAAPGYLLEQDVVLVAVRYRLGPFGFLSTMTEDIPGNVAVQDVILALQWVQKYITSFGGDPNRVTLFGQVGGAALINVLTLSSAVPDGLFHRVIYQSGSALSPAFIANNPENAAKDIAKNAGCKNFKKIDAVNRCLRKLNSTEILNAFITHGDSKALLGVGSYGGVQFVIGGPSGILSQHPGKLLAGENFKAYPTLGGSVKNAGSFILKDIYLDNFNETIIDDKLDGNGYIDHIISQTNGADPTGEWKKFAEEEIFSADDIKNGSFYKLAPGLIDMCSIIPFKNPVLLTMQANARKLANSTFLYTFDYDGELNRYSTNEDDEGSMPFELGVTLTDENLYLFPWPRLSTLNSNRDIKIAKRMVAYWVSFAATGVPKAPGVPEWPAMTDDTGPYMKIGKVATVGDNYLDEYTSAVKERKLGYNLVNEEYFGSLVAVSEEQSHGEVDGGEDEEEDEEEENNTNEARGTNLVIIAKRTKPSS